MKQYLGYIHAGTFYIFFPPEFKGRHFHFLITRPRARAAGVRPVYLGQYEGKFLAIEAENEPNETDRYIAYHASFLDVDVFKEWKQMLPAGAASA